MQAPLSADCLQPQHENTSTACFPLCCHKMDSIRLWQAMPIDITRLRQHFHLNPCWIDFSGSNISIFPAKLLLDFLNHFSTTTPLKSRSSAENETRRAALPLKQWTPINILINDNRTCIKKRKYGTERLWLWSGSSSNSRVVGSMSSSIERQRHSKGCWFSSWFHSRY